MRMKFWVGFTASILTLSSCAQQIAPLVTDDVAPVIGPVRLSDSSVPPAETTMGVEASDNVGLTRIEFYVGTQKVGELAPQGAQRGNYTVRIGMLGYACQPTKAVAYDAAGNFTPTYGSTFCP